ncbi:hypothetical protein Anapl_12322 [Anas platyrhynchos]|uniref:Uncharacterized protein n=1 Tax=Anas platyrhynchos TaxID=8839 RepID=R0JMB8_ANAPL|nr:hypothetical protein Anapl_12322 [Anas platyrhynchos]
MDANSLWSWFPRVEASPSSGSSRGKRSNKKHGHIYVTGDNLSKIHHLRRLAQNFCLYAAAARALQEVQRCCTVAAASCSLAVYWHKEQPELA